MKALGFRLSGRARRDLAGIFRYSKEKWGVERARSYIAFFEDAFRLLADNPALGRRRTGRDGEFRSWRHQRHIIVYEVEDDRIVIHHVLHERMDMTARSGLSETDAESYVP